MNIKPTLQYLEELDKQKYKEETLESQRIDLALKLDICPNCGNKLLPQNIFHRLFEYKKCSKCNARFEYIDLSTYDLP